MQTINDYLQILDNHTFSERTIQNVLIDRNIVSGTTITAVEQRLRELAKSDMYAIAASLVNKGGKTIKFGTQTLTESSITTSEETRLLWLTMCQEIRNKWGENNTGYSGQIYDATSLWK